MIGQTISHYRVIEKLGGGGMGDRTEFSRSPIQDLTPLSGSSSLTSTDV